MEHGGDGELAAKSGKPYADGGGGDDRLSALPDDILLQILLCLRLPPLGTGEAARTSVLSRRWRYLWYLLPEFHFGPQADGNSIRIALAAHEAPSLRRLSVWAVDASPGSMAEWLPVAARRLSGDLLLSNRKKDPKDAWEEGAFLKLPCFGSANSLSLNLECLGLAMPPSGVFARLTDLSLLGVRFHGPCELGAAVSSPRSPSLKKLTVHLARGLSNFTIHSKSLLQIVLKAMDLQQLNVVAPALKLLDVGGCFADALSQRRPVANISAPKLEILGWTDAFDPSSVKFGKMSNLQWLRTSSLFYVYGQEDYNRDCLSLLQLFQSDAIPRLSIILAYLKDITDYEYLMEDMTVLPTIVFLNLTVFANGHCIGPSVFHVLRMSTGVRRLNLEVRNHCNREACESDCVCDLQPNWTSEELVLNFLHEVEITGLRGTENEFTLVKRLFSWAAVLKEMTIKFHSSISESTAKELRKTLLSFSRPEIRMKFYIDHEFRKVLYVPEDECASPGLPAD